MGKNLISRIYERIKKPVLIGATGLTLAVMPYVGGCEGVNSYTKLYEAGPDQISDEAFHIYTSEYAGNFGPEYFENTKTK